MNATNSYGRLGGLVIAAGASVCGCAVDSADSAPEPGLFVAFARDFAGYTNWQTVTLQSTAEERPDGHTASGIRTIWYSQPRGSDGAFPVGTLLLKSDTEGRLLGMAKRGGGYNAQGARDWEWFRLRTGNVGPEIQWRGLGPPIAGDGDGDSYGHLDSCNGCHKAAADTDYVFAGVGD